MKQFSALLCVACLSLLSLSAQINYTLEAGTPTEELATHPEWENNCIVHLSNNKLVWGTTFRDPSTNQESVYIQGVDASVPGTYSVTFDRLYTGGQTGNGTRFHGMVESGGRLFVAASQEMAPGFSRYTFVFCIDPSNGLVFWRTPIHFGDHVDIQEMQLMTDMNGDLVVAFDLESNIYLAGNDFYWNGLGLIIFDPSSGAVLHAETQRDPLNVPDLFRLTDLKQSRVNGQYVLVGTYGQNGPDEEAFVIGFDPSVLAFGPFEVYDLVAGPEAHLSLADDGSVHYLSYLGPNQQLALIGLDITFAPTTNGFGEEFQPLPGKNQFFTNQLTFNPSTGLFELMLTMEDNNGVWSVGYGEIAPSSINQIDVWEYDYDPGTKENVPIGFVNKQIGTVDQYLFLTHPTTTINPGFSPISYVRILDSDNLLCLPPNQMATQALPVGINNWMSLVLVTNIQAEDITNKLRQDPYAGRVYDCNLGYLTNYRLAQASLEQDFTISLYPNPVAQTLHLEGDWEAYTQMQILDARGSIVRSGPAQPRIRVTDLPAGLYYLHLIGTQGTEAQVFRKE